MTDIATTTDSTTAVEDETVLDRRAVPRTRGLVSGILLILLGAWAGLAPFIGPYFEFAYTPQVDKTWKWTAARGYLEVAPGAVALLAGLMLIITARRRTACTWALFAAVAGAWLAIGPVVASQLKIHIGQPDPGWTHDVQTLEQLAYFYLTGALIVFVATLALGRLSVVSERDLRSAQARADAAAAERGFSWDDEPRYQAAASYPVAAPYAPAAPTAAPYEPAAPIAAPSSWAETTPFTPYVEPLSSSSYAPVENRTETETEMVKDAEAEHEDAGSEPTADAAVAAEQPHFPAPSDFDGAHDLELEHDLEAAPSAQPDAAAIPEHADERSHDEDADERSHDEDADERRQRRRRRAQPRTRQRLIGTHFSIDSANPSA